MKIIFQFLFIVLIFDLIETAIALVLAKFKKTHRLGVRLLASSLLGCFLCPYFCIQDCSTIECGNWTCDKYHKERNAQK